MASYAVIQEKRKNVLTINGSNNPEEQFPKQLIVKSSPDYRSSFQESVAAHAMIDACKMMKYVWDVDH